MKNCGRLIQVVFMCLICVGHTRLPQAQSSEAVENLRRWLASEPQDLRAVTDQPFADNHLGRDDAQQASRLVWDYYKSLHRETMRKRIEAKSITLGDKSMLWLEKRFGQPGPSGHALLISMHGGGGAPKAVNDRQWQNQIRLYEPAEGIVIAPRAPTDTWNLWHQSHIDGLFDELILAYAIAEGIDTGRVYLLGYSAGGDGVYQLAPRIADRFAAACMMAGHPNESQPLGLRNLPFAIFMGGKDTAYKRNEVARQWADRLGELRMADPSGYEHLVKIYEDKDHWMGGNDREGIPWMSAFRRQEFPSRIVWRQDDVTHESFYWLGVDPSLQETGRELTAIVRGNSIEIACSKSGQVDMWLNDSLVSLDNPVEVNFNGRTLFSGTVHRSVKIIVDSLLKFRDPRRICFARLSVALEKP